MGKILSIVRMGKTSKKTYANTHWIKTPLTNPNQPLLQEVIFELYDVYEGKELSREMAKELALQLEVIEERLYGDG